MHSLQELFSDPEFADISRFVVFRCKRPSETITEGTYARNVRWLKKLGRTGYWPIQRGQEFGGIVVLMDTLKGKRVEVWAGQSFGTNSGRLERRKDDGRWTLQVKEGFAFYGLLEGTVTEAIGSTPANVTNYVDRDNTANPRREKFPGSPGKLTTPLQAPESGRGPTSGHRPRGFNPEYAGDRVMAVPGSYTPTSLHGEVVNSLHVWLVSLGYKDLDNQSGWHDMHGQNSEGNWELFEVKSDASQISVYTALGQLQLYGLRTGRSRKFAVLPFTERAVGVWRGELAQLDVGLITFTKKNDSVAFKVHS